MSPHPPFEQRPFSLWPPLGRRCPPQSDSMLRPGPFPSPSFRLSQAIFEPHPFLYKYPNNLISVILPTYNAYEDGTDSVLRNVGI